MIAAPVHAVIALSQFLRASGAPWGGLVWGGGRGDVLSPPLRTASACAGSMLAWMAPVVLARAEAVPAGTGAGAR